MTSNQILGLGILGFVLSFFVVYAFDGGTATIEVEAIPNNLAPVVRVTNVGKKPITVRKITVNNRRECTEHPLLPEISLMIGGGIFPVKLGVGDSTGLASGCAIVRVLVETDQGSETFNFK